MDFNALPRRVSSMRTGTGVVSIIRRLWGSVTIAVAPQNMSPPCVRGQGGFWDRQRCLLHACRDRGSCDGASLGVLTLHGLSAAHLLTSGICGRNLEL